MSETGLASRGSEVPEVRRDRLMANLRTEAGRRMAAIVGFADTVPARTFSKAQMRGIAALILAIEAEAACHCAGACRCDRCRKDCAR